LGKASIGDAASVHGHHDLPITIMPVRILDRRLRQKPDRRPAVDDRSEEHTSELQSHSGISYAVFSLRKKKKHKQKTRKLK